jgi:Xaa-Pro aminopeptidase
VPGSTLGKVHALSVRLLSEALVELRLLPGVSAEQLAAGAYRPFYAHSVGHYLGMDVHDTNTVGPHRTLESGVVLALEPALYVPNSPQFGRYAGLGVRLEDDVLVTPSGPEVLSSAAPLQPDDVEAAVCAGPEAADSAAAAAAAAAAAVLATNAGHERWPARVRWGMAGGVVDGEGMLAAHEATA